MTRRTLSATVQAVHQVTPLMRRVVLAGPELPDMAGPPGALGPYLKLHLAGEGGRRCVRTYSVRLWDDARREVHVDVLLHEAGIGSDFAVRARAGDAVQIGGPGHIPARPHAAYLLAGDHTALPAIAQIVENLPAHCRVTALVEIPGPAEEQPVAGAASVDLRWLHRPAGAPSRLAAAFCDAWPAEDADLLVWAGAEAAIARAIRSHARTTRGIPPARCQVLNYWKAGQPEGGFSYVD